MRGHGAGHGLLVDGQHWHAIIAGEPQGSLLGPQSVVLLGEGTKGEVGLLDDDVVAQALDEGLELLGGLDGTDIDDDALRDHDFRGRLRGALVALHAVEQLDARFLQLVAGEDEPGFDPVQAPLEGLAGPHGFDLSIGVGDGKSRVDDSSGSSMGTG